jgi:hypothetical protein
MAKAESDVFIYKVKKDDYRAHPSPFVAHGAGTEVKFRNLTDETVEIDFTGMPVHEPTLTLAASGIDSVFVNGDATPGYYTYAAHALVRAAAPAASRRRAAKAPSRKAPRRVAVRGSSPPTVIVDV